MWSTLIIFERCDYAYMINMKLRLNKAKFEDVKISEIIDKQTCSLKISCSSNVGQVQNFVSVILAENIVNIYKTKMFSNLINIKGKLSFDNALINLLIRFEIDNDYAFVFNRLDVTKNVVVKSFFDFRCGILKSKWLELIYLTNSNIQFLYNTDVAVEFMSYLLNNISCSGRVNVKFVNDCYELTTTKQKICVTTADGLISNLLLLTPKQINIYCVDNIENATFNLMYKLFNKRINLLV